MTPATATVSGCEVIIISVPRVRYVARYRPMSGPIGDLIRLMNRGWPRLTPRSISGCVASLDTSDDSDSIPQVKQSPIGPQWAPRRGGWGGGGAGGAPFRGVPRINILTLRAPPAGTRLHYFFFVGFCLARPPPTLLSPARPRLLASRSLEPAPADGIRLAR